MIETLWEIIMQRNLKKIWPAAAASLIAFTNISFADAESVQMRHLENRVTALEHHRGANGVINPPARPQVNGGLISLSKPMFSMWQAHEDGLPSTSKMKGKDDLRDAEVKGSIGTGTGDSVSALASTANTTDGMFSSTGCAFTGVLETWPADKGNALWPSLIVQQQLIRGRLSATS